jgi:hypothetical protein
MSCCEREIKTITRPDQTVLNQLSNRMMTWFHRMCAWLIARQQVEIRDINADGVPQTGQIAD